jgi:hypothetical protein
MSNPYMERSSTESHPRPKVAKIRAPDAATAPASRRDLQKANTLPLLDREKEQLFEQFLEWRRRQKDIP